MDFYVIQDADTGLCLPFTKKGYTTSELSDPKVHPPRLFTSKRGAALAKAAWLKGVHRASWDFADSDGYHGGGGMYVDSIDIVKKPTRARTNLQVVKAYLHLET